MTAYTAPVKDMQFVFSELAGLAEIARLPGYEDASDDVVKTILEEAGKFSSEVLAPINRTGDEQGSSLVGNQVLVPDGFAGAYQLYVENGWPALGQSQEIGGQGFPSLINAAVAEMLNSANLSFALCPLLNTGAIGAIQGYGSDQIRNTFLPPLVSGSWTGTMNLTEPQAGSDLAAIRCRAEPDGDHYLVTGQKIFITWGDHEMCENVVHLVLARLPDAPPGIKGISLFVVPKFLVTEDGSLGERNDVYAVSLEHKLGVRACPTCVMSFGDHGGAVAYLVGEANRGLACMFAMMNHIRLYCGLQGVAISERSYQQAVEYARNRVQGRAPGHQGRVAIIEHADVRRMLMLMRAQTEAMRCICYIASAALDFAEHGEDVAQRASSQARLELLTPVVKAWCSEVSQEVTTLGIQIHGGMGFVEETGAAQHFRDARITTIYEGTTGIQAADLVGRKVLRDGGKAMAVLLDEVDEFTASVATDHEQLGHLARSVAQGRQMLAEATGWILEHAESDPNIPGSVSVNFLMLTGTVLGGWQMTRAAVAAQKLLDAGDADSSFYQSKIVVSRFYIEQVMPRAKAYLDAVLAGADNIMELPADLL